MRTTTRNRQQTRKRAQQRAFGESLRSWMQDRANAAEKRRAARRKERRSDEGRGVSRVPARLRGLAVNTVWVHQHEGRGPHTPYRNPLRTEKLARAGRLRKELIP